MRARIVLTVALVLALAACGERSAAAPQASPFKSTDITGIGWGGDFHLVDHSGRARSLADFKGKVVMLFFGYTHCPDMCPTTLAQMAQVRTKLGADASRVQGLFATIDPERDTPEVMAKYVAAFDRSFLGLRGDAATTAALAKEFKVYFSANKADPNGHYTVDHMGAVYVFDPAGRLRLLMTAGTGVDVMAADVATLLEKKT